MTAKINKLLDELEKEIRQLVNDVPTQALIMDRDQWRERALKAEGQVEAIQNLLNKRTAFSDISAFMRDQ